MPVLTDSMESITPMVAARPTTITMDCQKRDFRLFKFRAETIQIWRSMGQRPESAVAMSIRFSRSAGKAELIKATSAAERKAQTNTITVVVGMGRPWPGGRKRGMTLE